MALASAGCEMSSSSYTAGPRPQLPRLWAAELPSLASTQALQRDGRRDCEAGGSGRRGWARARNRLARSAGGCARASGRQSSKEEALADAAPYTVRSVLVPTASLANTWRNCLHGGRRNATQSFHEHQPHLEHLECSRQPHIQGRGAKKRTQRAG